MAKTHVLPPLSEAQLEIMNVVWDRGEVTVAQVWKILSTRRKVARNTVQTMLARLEEKGWLRCDSEGHAPIPGRGASRSDAGQDDSPAGRYGFRRLGRGTDPGLASRAGGFEG